MIVNITSSRSRGLLFEGKFSFHRSAVGSVIDGIFFRTDFRDSVVPKHANFKPKRIFFLDLCIQSNSVHYRQILTAVVHLSFMYVFILIFVNQTVTPRESLITRLPSPSKSLKALCKPTQHCWPSTPNIVRCYMLRPLAHPECCMLLRVVMSCCAKFETGQTLSYAQTDATIPNIAGQQCWEFLCPFARSLKVLLQHQSTILFYQL